MANSNGENKDKITCRKDSSGNIIECTQGDSLEEVRNKALHQQDAQSTEKENNQEGNT